MTVGNKSPSTKTFTATLDHLYGMLELICNYATDLGFSEAQMAKIELASEEALVNIISYAYPKKQGEVEITCAKTKKGLEIILKDHGISYDPVKHAEASKQMIEHSDPIELRKLGGYGIFFILTLMDEVRYTRDGEYNVLSMTKYFRDKNP